MKSAGALLTKVSQPSGGGNAMLVLGGLILFTAFGGWLSARVLARLLRRRRA